MRDKGRIFMSLSAMVIAAWIVITALKWPLGTALFPVIIGIPVFLMAMGELLLTISEKKHITEKQSTEALNVSKKMNKASSAPRTLLAFVMVGGLFLLILSLGFQIGVPLFVFLYLKIYGRERWGISMVLTASAWASIYIFFIRILNFPFQEGWVQKTLRTIGIG